MATMKLTSIANRQRTYLVRDLMFAALVAVMLAFQISAFTTAGPSVTAGVDGEVRVTEASDAASTIHPSPTAQLGATVAGACSGAPAC